MSPRDTTSWIVATGQAWKLYVAVAGFTGSLGCFTLGLFSLAAGSGRSVAWIVCGLFLGAATFVWFVVALRCPHCRAKLVWTMVATRPHSTWVIDLAALEECPVCRAALADRLRIV